MAIARGLCTPPPMRSSRTPRQSVSITLTVPFVVSTA
jgi:hypothetical protein